VAPTPLDAHARRLSRVAGIPGKRAKPSPWRFLRAAPVALVAVAVWVMVGFFLLLPGSGTDQAHDWGIDPIPTASDDEGPSGQAPSPARSLEPSAPGAAQSRSSASAQAGPVSEQTPAGDLELSGASTSGPNAQPRERPASDPTDPAPTQAASAHSGSGPDDNPGKKKGHDKPHGHQP